MLFMQTGGPNWVINEATFWGIEPGDIGVGQLLSDTLAIIDAEATAAEQAGQGCNLRNMESTYKLGAYVRPWYGIHTPHVSPAFQVCTRALSICLPVVRHV